MLNKAGRTPLDGQVTGVDHGKTAGPAGNHGEARIDIDCCAGDVLENKSVLRGSDIGRIAGAECDRRAIEGFARRRAPMNLIGLPDLCNFSFCLALPQSPKGYYEPLERLGDLGRNVKIECDHVRSKSIF